MVTKAVAVLTACVLLAWGPDVGATQRHHVTEVGFAAGETTTSCMAEQVMDLLCELNRREGQTIVLVTHDPSIGERAGRLIRMRDGRLVGDTAQPRRDTAQPHRDTAQPHRDTAQPHLDADAVGNVAVG